MLLTLNKVCLWLMSPIFLLQVMHLRRTAPRLPEPDCPRVGVTGKGRPLRILILGDSAGAGVGSPTQEKALTGQVCRALSSDYRVCWTIFAKTGWTTRKLLDHLEQVPAQEFDVIITSLGINDLTQRVPSDTWILQQEVLVWRLRERFGHPLMCLSGLPPVGQFPALPHPLRWWLGRQSEYRSRLLRDWCQRQDDCHYIHFLAPITPDMMASDGFHPGPPIYKIWGDLIADAIREKIPL